MENNAELNAFFKRNEHMWQIWQQDGINSETEFIVNFQFYAPKEADMKLLCKKLTTRSIPNKIKETRTLIFIKGWKVEADISKKWTLAELQKENRGDVCSSATDESYLGRL